MSKRDDLLKSLGDGGSKGMVGESTPPGLGFRETMKLLKHLHALHMTPLARAQACGHWPWEVDPDGGGDDDAA